jgi:hypothetical protein
VSLVSPSDEQRLRWRLLQADVAHLSERLDHYAAELGLALNEQPAATGDADVFHSTASPGRAATYEGNGLRNSPVTVRGAWQQMPASVAADAWLALVGWVDALVERYQLHEQLPDCWYRHGSMVEELHALHVAWCGAYYGTHAMPTDQAFWHDHLERVLARISRWDLRGCISGQHRDTPLPLVEAKLAEDREHYIQVDLRQRATSERTAAGHDLS